MILAHRRTTYLEDEVGIEPNDARLCRPMPYRLATRPQEFQLTPRSKNAAPKPERLKHLTAARRHAVAVTFTSTTELLCRRPESDREKSCKRPPEQKGHGERSFSNM